MADPVPPVPPRRHRESENHADGLRATALRLLSPPSSSFMFARYQHRGRRRNAISPPPPPSESSVETTPVQHRVPLPLPRRLALSLPLQPPIAYPEDFSENASLPTQRGAPPAYPGARIMTIADEPDDDDDLSLAITDDDYDDDDEEVMVDGETDRDDPNMDVRSVMLTQRFDNYTHLNTPIKVYGDKREAVVASYSVAITLKRHTAFRERQESIVVQIAGISVTKVFLEAVVDACEKEMFYAVVVHKDDIQAQVDVRGRLLLVDKARAGKVVLGYMGSLNTLYAIKAILDHDALGMITSKVTWQVTVHGDRHLPSYVYGKLKGAKLYQDSVEYLVTLRGSVITLSNSKTEVYIDSSVIVSLSAIIRDRTIEYCDNLHNGINHHGTAAKLVVIKLKQRIFLAMHSKRWLDIGADNEQATYAAIDGLAERVKKMGGFKTQYLTPNDSCKYQWWQTIYQPPACLPTKAMIEDSPQA